MAPHKNFDQHLGRLVREKREAFSWSQDDLAHWLHVDRVSVTNLEAGKRKISAAELAILCIRLHIDGHDFLMRAASASGDATMRGCNSKLESGR